MKAKKLPFLRMQKDGVVFHSNNEHKIKISNAKTMMLGNVLYLHLQNKLVLFANVCNVRIFENHLYFKALGKVKIRFDCSEFYRYFNLKIESKQFNMEQLKQESMEDLLNNNFDINFSLLAKKYIKIINNVLNIHIFKKKIIIKHNLYNLSYVLIYKLNNVIKRVVVNETI